MATVPKALPLGQFFWTREHFSEILKFFVYVVILRLILLAIICLYDSSQVWVLLYDD